MCLIKTLMGDMGIVESYTDGLRYMIENEKAFNRQTNRGELGVRA